MIVFKVPTGDTNGKAFMKDLYQTYSRLMYATVLRMIPDCQDCEDIVQDAVESLCKKVHTLMGLPAPALTVYIVYTVKNNFKRRQTVVDRHIIPMANPSLERLEAPDPPPETKLELEERVNALYKAWSQLPEQDRELLYRKYVLRQDNEELAEFLRCKPDSVRMRLTRAKRKAAALMKGDGSHDRARTLA